MEVKDLLFRQAHELVSKNLHTKDNDWFEYRDALRLYKSELSLRWGNYFESILDRVIDLTDAIKEMKTPQGNDLRSIKEQRKHINWLEKRQKFLKTRLVR